MRIILRNIQSISQAVYDIEETGITQITGDNSNGKSILIKAVMFVATCAISDAEERNTIINDKCNFGDIVMERNKSKLHVYITRERENCYYRYIDDTIDIKRTIVEGGLNKLVEKFGWVVFDDNICLQVFETFGIMPFVNNRASSDYQIVDTIITDKMANLFVKQYETITFPLFRKYTSELKAKQDFIQSQLNSITVYDIDMYQDILYKLKKYQQNIQFLMTIEPKRLNISSVVKHVNLSSIEVKRLYIPRVFPVLIEVKNISVSMNEYVTALNGICPTCGTLLINVKIHT